MENSGGNWKNLENRPGNFPRFSMVNTGKLPDPENFSMEEIGKYVRIFHGKFYQKM